MNSIPQKQISQFSNLAKFIKDTTGCSRKHSRRLANQYANKLEKTTFSCDLTKYNDAIPVERVYGDCIHTCSCMSKRHSITKKVSLIRKFLNNAAAEEAYYNRATQSL